MQERTTEIKNQKEIIYESKDWIIKMTENFQKVKIAVLGDLMLDDYIIGKVERISPEAPVPVVNVEEENLYWEERQTLSIIYRSWERKCIV